jgi:ribosomal protein S18 acetylase RimI-like enzyme
MPQRHDLRFESLASQHLSQVATLHEACFEGQYLTRFGPHFLEAMYGWYVSTPEAIAHVALDPSGQVVGFVAGTTDASSYHRSLFRHSGGALLAALLRLLVGHPLRALGLVWERRDMLPRALSALVSTSPEASLESPRADHDEPHAASLVSIGVSPSQRRKGIARHLTEIFLTDARERGCASVSLSVREDNEGARRFYESLGWEQTSRSSTAYHGSHSITYEKSTRGKDGRRR